jgi:hypothetical protein
MKTIEKIVIIDVHNPINTKISLLILLNLKFSQDAKDIKE